MQSTGHTSTHDASLQQGCKITKLMESLPFTRYLTLMSNIGRTRGTCQLCELAVDHVRDFQGAPPRNMLSAAASWPPCILPARAAGACEGKRVGCNAGTGSSSSNTVYRQRGCAALVPGRCRGISQPSRHLQHHCMSVRASDKGCDEAFHTACRKCRPLTATPGRTPVLRSFPRRRLGIAGEFGVRGPTEPRRAGIVGSLVAATPLLSGSCTSVAGWVNPTVPKSNCGP